MTPNLRPLPVLLALTGLFAPGQQAVQAFKLPTGLACLLLENHERPLVRAELKVQWGPSEAPAVESGQVGFLAYLLESCGAGAFSRADLRRAADELGMRRSFNVTRDSFRWNILVDSRSQEPAFDLLANVVFRPAFDSPVMEGQRQFLLKKAASASLREGAMERFLWNLSDPRSILVPGGQGLAHPELKDALALHRRLVRPENAVLILYGDLSLPQAKELATLHLGVWGPPPEAPPAPLQAVPSVHQPAFLAVLESAPKAELWAGALRKGPGRAGVDALLRILLERRSLPPSAGLELALSLEPDGPLLIKAAVRNTGRETLVPGLMAALENLRTHGFTLEELNRAKVQWRGWKTALALHPEALLAAVRSQALEPSLEQAVDALTVKDLNEALAAWLDPAGLKFLMLGGDAAMLQAAKHAGLPDPVLVKPQ